MEINHLKVNQIVDSISETHRFNKQKLYAVNTSDILDGDFMCPQLLDVGKLKGQFKKTIKKNDILFSEIRPANKRFAKVDFDDTSDYVVSTKLMVLRKTNNDVDLDYFYYWLTNDMNLKILQSRAENRICSFPQITFDILSEYDVPVPCLKSQVKIATFLKHIDLKIKANKKIISTLENLSSNYFSYWFLQYEFPNDDGISYKSNNGKLIFNEHLKRNIPDGWKVENLMNNSLCKDIKSGVKYFKTKNYLPTANINGEDIIDGEDISYENRENRANMEPLEYSVWFAKMKNSIKHLSIPSNHKWFTDKYILSTGFQGLKCNEKTFAYIHCFINQPWFEKYKDLLSHGATQEGVNNEDLKNIQILIPTEKVLSKFAKIINPMLEEKFSKMRENKELVSLKNFILPLLMNGQVEFE